MVSSLWLLRLTKIHAVAPKNSSSSVFMSGYKICVFAGGVYCGNIHPVYNRSFAFKKRMVFSSSAVFQKKMHQSDIAHRQSYSKDMNIVNPEQAKQCLMVCRHTNIGVPQKWKKKKRYGGKICLTSHSFIACEITKFKMVKSMQSVILTQLGKLFHCTPFATLKLHIWTIANQVPLCSLFFFFTLIYLTDWL